MKTDIMIVAVIITGGLTFNALAQDEEGEWLKKNVVVKTTETEQRNPAGAVVSTEVVRESRINITRTVTETKQADKGGCLRVIRRVTDTVDTLGNKVKMVEELTARGQLVMTSVVSDSKTPVGTVSTVEGMDRYGNLILTRRVTQARNEQGVIVMTVETPDAHGNMVVTQVTTQQQALGPMK